MKDNLQRSLTEGVGKRSMPIQRHTPTHKQKLMHTHACTHIHCFTCLFSFILHFFLLLFITPTLPFLLFCHLSQHSCSWISKAIYQQKKAECLANRSLSQTGLDCGIPASHSLGTVFAPLGAPAITAMGLLLHLHL